MSAVSPDRRLMLYTDTRHLYLYDFTISELYKTIETDSKLDFFLEKPDFFLGSNYMLTWDGDKEWAIWSISGEKKEDVEFFIENKNRSCYMFGFTQDFTRALVVFEEDRNKKMQFVDTTSFRNWLMDKGYLYKHRNALLNDSSVRLRHYPYLDEEVLGLLNKGEKVVVTDVSSFQQTIGGKTAYWYKLKLNDGTEGWAFGQFIDLGEELVYKTELKSIVTASPLPAEKSVAKQYHPVRVLDGFPDTCWKEAAKGSGINEWIEITLTNPATVDRLVISPGWFFNAGEGVPNGNFWADHNRVKSMRIELDGYVQEVTFQDVMKPQEVVLPSPKTFSRARFIIKDVYKSKKNADTTCISEIEFWSGGKKLEIDISGFAEQMKVVAE